MSIAQPAFSLFIAAAGLFIVVVGFGLAGYAPMRLQWHNGKDPVPQPTPARRVPKEERTHSRLYVILTSQLFWVSIGLMILSGLLMVFGR
ncbi:hypothetical protein GCM10027018_28380 [Paenibacillus thermoaerophilus]